MFGPSVEHLIGVEAKNAGIDNTKKKKNLASDPVVDEVLNRTLLVDHIDQAFALTNKEVRQNMRKIKKHLR